MKELGITKDPQEYLQEWEKKNNPFYPDEMRWDRVKVNTFLKDWKQQCNLLPSELLERYNEAIEVLQDLASECNKWATFNTGTSKKQFERALQTISKAKP